MSRAVVFVGPSLRRPENADRRLELRPPARRGDLLHAAAQDATTIALIDGVFGQSLAVTPAEIRQTFRSGVRLFGGASMGALRACECADAMRGVGEIWLRYVAGELTDDDEVAVTFDDASYELVAYPLVQVRETIRLAGNRYPHTLVELQELLARMRALPFFDRTLENMRQAAATLEQIGVPWADLHHWMTAPDFDVKRRDAEAVLSAVTASLGVP